MLHRLIKLASVAFLVSCAATDGPPPRPTEGVTNSIAVEKSPNDDRDYRYLVLQNRLRVLLASDPGTDKAAASLVVLRGQNHDPEQFGGLAHFLEHMLFIGTAKYPKVDEYQQFIAANGGSSNAYTGMDHTNYFFDIDPAYFHDALDRFAQFFIAPLLDPAYVDREKNAVDSEYRLQIKDDGWRGRAAMQAAMNPAHPASRFHIGSLETLGPGVNEALADFRRQNYSADQMILVALSSDSLDEMEALVTPRFEVIENHDIGPAPELPPAYDPADLPMAVTHASLRDSNSVTYNFPIPATDGYYLQKPVLYLTNLLGHEGAGSLHQRLKSAGWIESLAAGNRRLDAQNAFVSIDIELTEAGTEHIDDITALLFAYIDLLRAEPPRAWRYREQADVADLDFRFQEKSSATAFVYQVAPMLALYPPEHVLAAPFLMRDFEPQLIRSFLSYLRPDNLLMEIVGPDVETNLVEPWFQVPYRVDRNVDIASSANPGEMSLPEPNPFLPESLALLPDEPQGPRQVIHTPGLTLWMDRDTEFGVPRANLFLTLGVKGGLATPEDIVMARLHERLLSHARNELTYPALLAGMSYTLHITPEGFELRLSGYNDKQPALLDALLDGFADVPLDEEQFAVAKDELTRQWRNFSREKPYTQTYATMNYMLLSSSWPPEELVRAIADVDIDRLRAWRRSRLDGFHVVGLAHGNVNEAAVADIAQLVRDRLPLASFELLQPDVRDVSRAMRLELPVDHQDASMVLHVQDADSSFEARARSALATQLLRQRYFTSLRTEQQLGYVVTITNRPVRDRGGVTFVVQSPVASAAQLETATRDFMAAQLPRIASMPDAEFEQHKSGLVTRLTERDQNLAERSQRLWADLDLGILTFDSSEQIADQVARLTKADMLSFLRSLNDALKNHRLLIYSRGQFADTPSDGTAVLDVESFKSG